MKQTHKEKRERNREIVHMVIAKKPLNDIASHFGLSEVTIRRVYTEMITVFPGKLKQRNQEIYKKILEGKSFRQVAYEYNLTYERIRQVYRKLGGLFPLPYKKKKKQENFIRGLKIAEEYMTGKKVFPPKNELFQFLLKRRASTYAVKIYKVLQKIYKNIPLCRTLKKQKRKEKLLNDLRQLYRKVKMPLSYKYHLKKYGLATAGTYNYHFGMFKSACKLAGVPYGKRGGNAKEKSRLIYSSLLLKL